MNFKISDKTEYVFYAIFGIILGINVTISTAIIRGCLFSLILFFIISGNYKLKLSILKRYYVWPAIVLFLSGIIGMLYSQAGFNESFWFAKRSHTLLTVWIIAYACRKYPDLAKKFFISFLIGVFANLIAIYLNYFILGPAHAIKFSSPTFPSADTYFVVGFIFPITAFMFFSMAYAIKDNKKRIILIVLGLIILTAELGLNNSRTGYVIEFSVLAVGFLMRYKWHGFSLSIALLPAIFLVFNHLSPNFHKRVNLAKTNIAKYYENGDHTTSTGIRMAKYYTYYESIISSPVNFFIGCGTGSSEFCTKETVKNKISRENKKYTLPSENADNTYLHIWLRSGILALFIFIYWLVILFNKAKSLPAINTNNVRIIVVAFSVGAFFNLWLEDISISVIFCYLIAIMFSYDKKEEDINV